MSGQEVAASPGHMSFGSVDGLWAYMQTHICIHIHIYIYMYIYFPSPLATLSYLIKHPHITGLLAC